MHLPVSPRPVRGLFLCLAVLGAFGAEARVWTPESDHTLILELTPDRPPGLVTAPPPSLDSALDEAKRQLALLVRTGSPGAAVAVQNLVSPWLDQSSRAVLLLARSQQHQHQFDLALQTLQRYPAEPPHHLEAALLQASILRLQGNYPAALDACARIPARLPESELCRWPIRSLQGELPAAVAALSVLSLPAQAPTLAHWRHSELAEMHERLGDDEQALRHWLSALKQDSKDLFTATAASDLLIRLGRADAALQLLQDLPPRDTVLIRRAAARKALNQDDWEPLAEQVWQRLQIAEQVHGQAHPRELAQIALLKGQSLPALEWAQRNWQEQKEPLDARLLIQAAIAADRTSAAEAVRQWLWQTGLQDARMKPAKGGAR